MKYFFYIFLVLYLAAFVSCDKDSDNPSESSGEIKTMTITHMGVDWSEGKVGTETNQLEWEKTDGETIGWCTFGQWLDGVVGVWYRPYNDKMYRLNTDDLTTVSSIDTTKWETDVCDKPLQAGDVWAAACRDGFVVFRVKSNPGTGDTFWPCEVQFKFSKSTKF